MATSDNSQKPSALPASKSSIAAKKINKVAKTGGGPHRKMQTPPSIMAIIAGIIAVGSFLVWTSRQDSIAGASPRAAVFDSSNVQIQEGDNFAAAYGIYVCDAKPKDGATPAATPETTTTTTTTLPVTDPNTTTSSTTTTTTIAPDPYAGNRTGGWVAALQNPSSDQTATINGFYTKNLKDPADASKFLAKGDGIIYASPTDSRARPNTLEKANDGLTRTSDGSTYEYIYSGRRARLEAFFVSQNNIVINKDKIDLSSGLLSTDDQTKPAKVWNNGDECSDGKKGVVSVWVGQVAESRVEKIKKLRADFKSKQTEILQGTGTDDEKKSQISAAQTTTSNDIKAQIGSIDLSKVSQDPSKIRMRDNAVYVFAFLPEGEKPPVPTDSVNNLYTIFENAAPTSAATESTTTTVASDPNASSTSTTIA